MIRTEAQALQAELGDTVEWLWGSAGAFGGVVHAVDGFDFIGGTYTYRAKATVKLNGEMVTREQAIAEWKSKKETHDVWFKLGDGIWDDVVTQGVEHDLLAERLFPTSFPECEYELRTKPAKVVAWEGSREDVIALLKEVGLL
jgi:hypothetical protein